MLDHDCTSGSDKRMEEPLPKPPAVDLQLCLAPRRKSLTFSTRSSPRRTFRLPTLQCNHPYTVNCLLLSAEKADLVQARSGPQLSISALISLQGFIHMPRLMQLVTVA